MNPYAPLSGALADALARLPARDRAGAVARAGPVGLLLPELATARRARPGRGTGAGRAGASSGVLLAASAGGCCARRACPAGTLLVLDDLHWAGPDAAGLLAWLLAAAAGARCG